MSNEGRIDLLHRETTDKIIGGFYDTYNELGSGFPEFVCVKALAATLQDLGMHAVEEAQLPVYFRGRRIVRFQADLVVDDVVIVEVKITHAFEPFHQAQLLHYLKASGLSVGLLVTFGREPKFKRVVFEHAATRHLKSPHPGATLTEPDSGTVEKSSEWPDETARDKHSFDPR
jgi:GxxExxY protein